MDKITFEEAIGFFGEHLDRIKKGLEAKGFPSAWVDSVPSVGGFGDFFLPRGKMKSGVKCYLSDCPHYTGRWLAGVSGAVDCALVDGLLPGVIGEDFCTKDPDRCPISKLSVSREVCNEI